MRACEAAQMTARMKVLEMIVRHNQNQIFSTESVNRNEEIQEKFEASSKTQYLISHKAHIFLSNKLFRRAEAETRAVDKSSILQPERIRRFNLV